jgi:hypothetical protein
VLIQRDAASGRMSLAQNCKALNQPTKVWSHAVFLKETIYQKIFLRRISLHNTYQIKLKPGGYLTKNFGPALCGIALDKSLQSNISANSTQKSKIF